MSKLKIGISIGDINGIGPEVIIKALSHPEMTKMAKFVVYGSSKVLSYYKNTLGDINFYSVNISDISRASDTKINVFNCWNDTAEIKMGQATEASGKYAQYALDQAVDDLKDGKIQALVTAPINKHAMNKDSFPYNGHTDFLKDVLKEKDNLMLMVADDLRVATVTHHVPLSEVASMITKDLVKRKIQILHNSLQRDFGIEKPQIAVLGLNPHASDEGRIGSEEGDILRPLIIELKKAGLLISGPYPADGFFGNGSYKKVDAVLAMYHDQGLIPFKTLAFGEGTNYTAGMHYVRTSPDHGTAYDITGKNQADPASLRKAIYLALDVARSRFDFDESRENALIKKPKQTEEV